MISAGRHTHYPTHSLPLRKQLLFPLEDLPPLGEVKLSLLHELSSCLGSQASPSLAIPMPPSYRVSLAWRHAPAGMQE